jgi:hypothetical protein
MTHDLRSGGPLLLAGLVVPAYLLVAMLRDGKPLQQSATAALTVLLVACVAGYPLFRLLAWTKFRAMPAHLQAIEMSFQESGIRVKTSKGSQAVGWGAIAKVRSDGPNVYLFLSRRSALIVPKRAFTTQADVISFLDLARRQTGSR